MTENTNRPLIEVKDLKEYFPINTGLLRTRPLKAVDGVSFSINRGETLGLVGESGCGKTTVGKSILRIYHPTDGEVLYKGQDILKMPENEFSKYRRELQMVFQDPYSSIDPRQSVFGVVKETLLAGGKKYSSAEIKEKVNGYELQIDNVLSKDILEGIRTGKYQYAVCPHRILIGEGDIQEERY